MDIKNQIEEVVNKVKSDPNFQEEFKKDPEKAVEKVLGVDIPDGAVDKVVDAVKVKLTADKVGGLADGLKGLLKK